MHSITSKLNKDARQFQNDKGVTFFVDLGEKNYNFQKKENEYTNYSAALFAKDAQIGFYQTALVKDAVIEVSGSGIIIEMPSDSQYKPKLMIQDAKLGYVNSPGNGQSMQQAPQQSAPQQSPQKPAYAPPPKPQPKLDETAQSWVTAVRANPAMINELQGEYKDYIQSLV